MKCPKIYFLLLIIGVIAFLVLGCENAETNIKDTNLSKVAFNNMKLGEDINNYDLSSYKESDKYSYPKDAQYKFENLVIRINKDNKIDYLFSTIENNEITIDGKPFIKTNIDELKKELGENFVTSKYDSEQRLDQCKYYNSESKTSLTIIYSSWDGEIVFFILERQAR